VTGGMAIYDTMNFLQCDVQTFCIGMAASMSTVLLAAGRRASARAAQQPRDDPPASGGAGGQAADIAIAAKGDPALAQDLSEVIARHTGKAQEQVDKDSDRDY